MRTIASLFVLAFLTFFAFSGHAQVYKWVDADGVTHYSQQPPEAGAAREIPVPGPAVAPIPEDDSTPEAADRRTEELTDDIRARRAEEDRQQAETDQQRAAACEQMRNNLKTLQERARVRIEDNGSSRVLTPEEHAQQIIDLEKRIEENCSQAQ